MRLAIALSILRHADQQEREGMVVQEQHEVLDIQAARPPIEEQCHGRDERQEQEHELRRRGGEALEESLAAVRAHALAGAAE